MKDLVDFNTASSLIQAIPLGNQTQLIENGFNMGSGWKALFVANLGLDVYGGLYTYQNGCAGISFIPGLDTMTGPICLAALISSMVVLGAAQVTAFEFIRGVGSFAESIIDKSEGRRELSYVDPNDITHYGGHMTNLTQWHEHWKLYGFETGLYDDPEAIYLREGECLYAFNSTSTLTGPEGHKLYIQHDLP